MTILLGLNLSDGHPSLADIGEQACMPFDARCSGNPASPQTVVEGLAVKNEALNVYEIHAVKEC